MQAYQREDGEWIAQSHVFATCHGQGPTEACAVTKLLEAIEDFVTYNREALQDDFESAINKEGVMRCVLRPAGSPKR
jgi:predicted RNase H-like HicB family nuclease